MDMGQRANAGSVIEGKYRLEKELGAGGMGSVWLATQLMVDRPVAVKLLHPAFIDQDELQARFEVEAKAIGRLNHPNVITLYDFGYSDDLSAFYTVIEYIDGESLDKRLNSRLSLKEIVKIIRQISLALDHAHHHGILHRDLKPENVMLARMTDGSEMVKVLDFGIARIVKGGDEQQSMETNRITKAGEVFGTPAYMSPEQARSIRQLQPSADLYSLGVMFYELAAGSLPFFAHSAFDLLMLHVTKPVPPIRREDMPKELAHLIYRLLEKDPKRRFQSGKELIQALDALDLPDEIAGDVDIDGGPTVVQQTPQPTIATPPPGALGDEETNPNSPFDAPRHLDEPGSAPSNRPTMMLDGDVSQVEFSTGSIASLPAYRSKLIAFAALGLLGIVMLMFVLVSVLQRDDPATDESLQPTAAQQASDRTASEQAAADQTEDQPVITPELNEAQVEPRDIAVRTVKHAESKRPKFPEEAELGAEEKDEDVPRVDEKAEAPKQKQKPRRAPARRRPRAKKSKPSKSSDQLAIPRISATDDDGSVAIPRVSTGD